MSQPNRPPFPLAHPRTTLLFFWLALTTALLGTAASPPPSPATPSPAVSAEAEAEAELAESEYEDEEWELEIEEEEAEEEELEAGPSVLPVECGLRTADPSVVAVPNHNRLRLTLRYTAEAPTRVGVDYWLKGGKGSLQLGSAKRSLGRHGVLRLNRRFDAQELSRVRAARVFMLRLDVPAADHYCKPYLIFRLAARHQRGSRTTWSELAERRS